MSPNILRGRRVLALIAWVALTAGCDLGTKQWASRSLAISEPGGRISLVANVMELRYTENRDAAFGLLHAAPEPVRRVMILVGALFAIALVVGMYRTLPPAMVRSRVGVGLLLGGALGNVLDRMRTGFVVDFIHLHWYRAFDWPVFNVADIAVAAGIALLVWDSFARPRGAAPNPPAPA